MTWHQSRAVLNIKGMPPSQKLVLLALSLRAGYDGQAWPSVPCLCADTGLSNRTVRRALKALAEGGYIAVHHEPGRGLQMTVIHAPPRPPTAVTVTGPPRSHRPRPRSETTKTAVTVTDGSKEGRSKEVGGPRDGETWGEYRERGGR
jgi:hypothetical protein